MTEKLYYKDAYISDFSARVLSCDALEGYYDIVLDKTAFFPEEAGQTADSGYIADSEVFDAREILGIVHHYAKAPVAVGETVSCKLNFDERLEKMRSHTAEHIVSGIFHSLYGVENTGFHLGHSDVTFDTSAPISREQLAEAERLANLAVRRDLEVTSYFPSADELPTLKYRSKLDLKENVRIVNIGDVDSCACCAPHVKHTGEIGYIRFIDCVKHKGGSRIRMLAGERAYDYITRLLQENSAISVMLCAPTSEISAEVKKLMDAKLECDRRISSLYERTAELYANSVKETEGDLLVCLPELDMNSLRSFVNLASARVGGMLLAVTGSDGDYKYVLHKSGDDFASSVKDLNSALCGKGGGRAPMAQGSLAAKLCDIQNYFGKNSH